MHTWTEMYGDPATSCTCTRSCCRIVEFQHLLNLGAHPGSGPDSFSSFPPPARPPLVEEEEGGG